MFLVSRWEQTHSSSSGAETLVLLLEKRYQSTRRCFSDLPGGVTSARAFAVCFATLFPFSKTAAVVCLDTHFMSGIFGCCVGVGFFLFPFPFVQHIRMKRETNRTQPKRQVPTFYSLCRLGPVKPRSSMIFWVSGPD